MYRKYIKLDAVPGGDPVRIYISQGDKRSRRIEFSLFASTGELTLPSGTVVKMKARRPDGEELEKQEQSSSRFPDPGGVCGIRRRYPGCHHRDQRQRTSDI